MQDPGEDRRAQLSDDFLNDLLDSPVSPATPPMSAPVEGGDGLRLADGTPVANLPASRIPELGDRVMFRQELDRAQRQLGEAIAAAQRLEGAVQGKDRELQVATTSSKQWERLVRDLQRFLVDILEADRSLDSVTGAIQLVEARELAKHDLVEEAKRARQSRLLRWSRLSRSASALVAGVSAGAALGERLSGGTLAGTFVGAAAVGFVALIGDLVGDPPPDESTDNEQGVADASCS